MRCVFILPCLIFMLIYNTLFYCYQRSIFFRYKFDLLPANSGLHEHGFWPTSLCCHAVQDNKSIKIFLNIFPLSFFKPTKNPGLIWADDTGLLFYSLLSEVDLKLFLLKVPPACFIFLFIMFYYTGLLITQNLIKKRHSHG